MDLDRSTALLKQVQNVDKKVGEIKLGSDYAKHYLVVGS